MDPLGGQTSAASYLYPFLVYLTKLKPASTEACSPTPTQAQHSSAADCMNKHLCTAYGDTSQACVSEQVASECAALAAAGCVELIIAESCPVQLSCAKSVCPATEPEENEACSSNGVTCTLKTYKCPGTTKQITTMWADCSENKWRVGVAKVSCPEPAETGLIAGGVAGGIAILAIAVVVYMCAKRRVRRSLATKPDIKPPTV